MDIQFTVSSNSVDSIGMGGDDEILIRSTSDSSVHLYGYRWFILALYSLLAFSNTLVWLSLFTVTDATSVFYNVREVNLIWSSAAFTCIQCVIAIPVSFLPSKLGLRTTMIIAAAVNAMGACIMVAGAHREGFLYFVLGQTVVAIAASILPQLAPEVSAVWFGKNEHAISTSVGITVGNAGAAVGFLQPALLIKNIDVEKHVDYVGGKIKAVIYSQAVLCVLLLCCIMIFFKPKPQKPPSVSQAIRPGPGSINFKTFKSNCKKVMCDRNYVITGHIFAFSSMIIIVVPIVLNQIMSSKFPNHDATFGWMGFGGITSGILGSIFFSIILDKTKAFKKVSLGVSIGSLVLWILFTELHFRVEILWLSVLAFIVALLIFIPFGPIIVDVIAEISYPVPESTSFAIPITAGRLYSIPVTFLLGYMMDKNWYYASCHVITGILMVCIFLLIIVEIKHKRAIAVYDADGDDDDDDDDDNFNTIIQDDASSIIEEEDY